MIAVLLVVGLVAAALVAHAVLAFVIGVAVIGPYTKILVVSEIVFFVPFGSAVAVAVMAIRAVIMFV